MAKKRKGHRVVLVVERGDPPFDSFAAAKRAIDWVCDEASGMQGALPGDECDENREEIEHIRRCLYNMVKLLKRSKRAKRRGRK